MAVLQRFGGALNLNVHIHALVLDGVFAKDESGALVFHPAPSLTALDVAEVLATVEPRIARLLNRRGIGDRDDSAGETDAWTDEAPVLAGLACPRCGGRLRLIALIDQVPVILKILRHLGLPSEIPAPAPARAPPLLNADRAAFDLGC